MRNVSRAVFLVGAAALFLCVRPAHAGIVYLWGCAGPDFWCGAGVGNIPVGADSITDGVGVLPIGATSNFPVALIDADTDLFFGIFTAVNVNGYLVTIDLTGAMTAGLPGFVDLLMTQSYVPAVLTPLAGATEYMTGTCAPAAPANGVAGQLIVDGGALPVMGGAGDCAGGVFAFAGAGIVPGPGWIITGAAQYAVGAGGDTITFPFGGTAENPEPATMALLGTGLLGMSLAARRSRRR